jgi:hypothetical protein
MKAIYKRRLLKCAGIVDKASRKNFTMGTFFHHCGTPACALGHYEYATRRTKAINRAFMLDSAQQHFDLTADEVIKLFGVYGCNEARTGKQAAKYIRNFVKQKEA